MYKAEDYTYRVFWSEEDSAWIATVDEFDLLSNINDSSQIEAFAGAVELVKFVLSEMYSDGAIPPEPLALKKYSGNISLRMTPEQHRRITMESAEQGVSINQLLISRI